MSAAKADCDSHNAAYILFCAKCPNLIYVGETSNHLRFRLKQKHSIKHNSPGYPVAMHFNEQSHSMEDIQCIAIKNQVPDKDNRKLIEKKTTTL